jgi:hypothetical protein
MGRQYKHIAVEERCEIFRLRAGGSSIRQSGSLAIYDNSGADAQQFGEDRLQADICGSAISSPALERFEVRPGR